MRGQDLLEGDTEAKEIELPFEGLLIGLKEKRARYQPHVKSRPFNEG